MTWMITATGRVPDLRFLGMDDIATEDIAAALCRTHRFNWQTSRPYTVAEHALIVHEILQRDQGVRSPFVLLASLVHFAHLGYTGDLSEGMRDHLGPTWQEEEERVRQAMLQHFDLVAVWECHRGRIEEACRSARAAVRAQLLPVVDLVPTRLEALSVAPAWLRLSDCDTWSADDWAATYHDHIEDLCQEVAQVRGLRARMEITHV
jgi:hypothetical protein